MVSNLHSLRLTLLPGIVVKAAMRYAQHPTTAETHLRALYEATFAIMFFAVPHGGSDAAAWGNIARNLGIIFNTNPTILRDLDSKIDTGYLNELGKEFGKMLGAKQFIIQTYTETHGMIPSPIRGINALEKVIHSGPVY